MPNIDLPLDFPARIRALRVAQHLSEAELADKAGLTYKTIRALETGRRRRVMERTVLTLAAVFDLSADDLLHGGEVSDSGLSESPPHQDARPGNWSSLPRFLGPGAVLLIGLALILGSALWYGRLHADLTVSRDCLTARDSLFGFELWQASNSATWTEGRQSPWDPRHFLVGTGSNTSNGGRLLCLDRASGDTIWSVEPDLRVLIEAFGADVVGAAGFSCSVFKPADVDGDGVPELIVRFVHGLYFPSCLCLVDKEGKRLAQYANKGHLRDFIAEDLDGDGRDEILVWGTNNCPAYQGATVIMLDQDHWSGASSDALCPIPGSSGDGSTIRLVIPAFPSPYMDLLNSPRLSAESLQAYHDAFDRLRFNVRVGSSDPNWVDVTLDEQLRPLTARAVDGFRVMMTTQWPDSLISGTGPGDETWLQAWMKTSRRFVSGIPTSMN